MIGSAGIRSPEEPACPLSPSCEDFSSSNHAANPTLPPAVWALRCANFPNTSRKNTHTDPFLPKVSATRSCTKAPFTKPAIGRPSDLAKASNATKANSTPTNNPRKNTGSIRSGKTPNCFYQVPPPSPKFSKKAPLRELPERAAPYPTITSAVYQTHSISSPITAAPYPVAMPKSACSASSPMACSSAHPMSKPSGNAAQPLARPAPRHRPQLPQLRRPPHHAQLRRP